MLYFRMGKLFETITDLPAAAETLRRRRYGVIETRDGQFVAVHLRPWPKFVSIFSVLFGQWYHKHVRGDRLWLYYNQPRRHTQFIALKYIVSARNTSWATFMQSLRVLDKIAHIKRTDALLCDAANLRLTPRLLARLGWQPHAKSRWHRNYIKRFCSSSSQPTQNRISRSTLAATAT